MPSSSSLPHRIAILECDTPLAGTRATYGGYGGVFTALLQSGAASLDPPLGASALAISTFDVVTAQEYPSLDAVDSILITGSRYNSFDDDAWIRKLVAFTDLVLKQRRVRLVGVCYGHQIVARVLGAKVARSDRGWELGVTPVDLTERGKELFGLPALVRGSSSSSAVHAFSLPSSFFFL